ncbi:unnamed protein product [Ectocarpus sp. 12 AP-2014]
MVTSGSASPASFSSICQRPTAISVAGPKRKSARCCAGYSGTITNFLPREKQPAEVIGFLQGRLKSAYGILDAHLANRDWIVGDAPTNADLTCCGYLFYPEPFGFARSDWPAIDRWLANLEALPRWKSPYDLMPGSPADRT